jgi:hypothetical protein
MAKLIVVDSENNADAWWDAARTRMAEVDADPDMSSGTRAVLLRLLDEGGDFIQVSNGVAEEIEFWASGLIGWDDGPEHAPTPLLFQDA